MKRISLLQLNLLLFGVLILLGIGIFLGYQLQAPKWDVHKIQSESYAVLMKESKQSFLVTGRLDLQTDYRISDTKKMMGIDLGTTQTEIRIPGTAYYGIKTAALQKADFEMQGDTLIVQLPPTELLNVSPNLAAMQMKTEVGWARLYKNSGRSIEQKALKSLPERMNAQALHYLNQSDSASTNTILAVKNLLLPVLQSNGVKNPKIWVQPQSHSFKQKR